MEMSDKTDAIFPAVVAMQAAISNAGKSSQGHGYKYADLAECIDTAKPHLADAGLAVSQLLGVADAGPTLTTMLIHSSGQWIRSEFVIERATLQGGAGKNPAQVMGAGITYMRRYAYAAILGMAQSDDDAAGSDCGPVHEKPWFNDAEFYGLRDRFVTSIRSGDRTPDTIVENLKTRYKVSNDMAQKIGDLNNG